MQNTAASANLRFLVEVAFASRENFHEIPPALLLVSALLLASPLAAQDANEGPSTLDGSRLSMDALQGKVVLLDFWATWCGPCREALPHIRDIARKFQGEPLVILSVSLDSDEQKWKDFVAKNQMTWPQYRDGGFNGSIAKMFFVSAIPHTFTLDADGVLQDEHIGDASIEGKLKKLIGQLAIRSHNQPPG